MPPSRTCASLAIGAPFKQVKSTGTEENGRTLNKGLTVILDNDEMLPGDEERWAGRLTRRIFRNDLVRAYAGLISAATPSALVWNGKSAPDADVAKLLFQGGEERGLASNSVVYGGAAWLYRFLAYSDAARQNGGAAAALTPEQLAMLLMVDSVLVSKAYKQSTASAKAAVLGSYVLAYHAQANASPDDPSNIKRFVTPVEGGGKVTPVEGSLFVQPLDRAIVRDDVELIVARLHGWIDDPMVDCVITTGGTGVTGRDVTPEAFDRVLDLQSVVNHGVTRLQVGGIEMIAEHIRWPGNSEHQHIVKIGKLLDGLAGFGGGDAIFEAVGPALADDLLDIPRHRLRFGGGGHEPQPRPGLRGGHGGLLSVGPELGIRRCGGA